MNKEEIKEMMSQTKNNQPDSPDELFELEGRQTSDERTRSGTMILNQSVKKGGLPTLKGFLEKDSPNALVGF